MKTDIFDNRWQFAKQKEIAIFILSRLLSVVSTEYPCENYESACSLARILQSLDKERLVHSIEIYKTFVRIKRNEKGAFAFSSVVLDHVERKASVSEGSTRS